MSLIISSISFITKNDICMLEEGLKKERAIGTAKKELDELGIPREIYGGNLVHEKNDVTIDITSKRCYSNINR